MPFVLLLLAFLLYVQDPWTPPWTPISPGEAALLNLVGYGTFVLLAGGLTLITLGWMRREPFARVEILRRFSKLKRWHFFGLTAYFIAGIYLLGWGWSVAAFIEDYAPPLVKLLVLAPYLITLMLTWTFTYDVERAAHASLWNAHEHRFLSRSAFVSLNIRHNLLLLLPPVILMTGQDILQLFLPELRERERFPLLTLGLLVAMMGSTVVFVPWLLRLFLGLRPLQAGPLRDHLTATARRIGFRFSDILVWDTRGTVANALVTGVIPQLRYVVLTDRLIHELEVDEIESVFGHEVGHVQHHHMGLYSLFLFLSLVMLGALWALGVDIAAAYLAPRLPFVTTLIEYPEWFLGIVIVYVFLVFGVLSRHCERQADLFGCQVASRDAFIRALDKVADINGMSRDKPGIFTAWQHWTIGQRIAFLRRIDDDPDLEVRAQRRIGILKWSLTLGLIAAIAVLVSAHPWGWLRYL